MAGEHIVLADLFLRGLNAHHASSGSPFDIIVDVDGRLLRMQVKTTRGLITTHTQHKNPFYLFHVKRCGKMGKKKYAEDAFDCYAFVALDKRQVAYLPFSEASQTAISIRDADHEYKGHNGGIRRGKSWQDLTWEKTRETLCK